MTSDVPVARFARCALACASLIATAIVSGCGGGSSGSSTDSTATSASASSAFAVTGQLADLPVFTSRRGVLDLLMVAEPAKPGVFSPYVSTAWVYTICERSSSSPETCPSGAPVGGGYNGTRIQVSAGDTLKVHLVNRLPPITDSAHAADPGMGYLALNPTNLHTHGLLVSPRYASTSDPTWGDNVFVDAFNRANGPIPPGSMVHGAVQWGSIDYVYKIPADHPSGLLWFHPHLHGIALGQVTAGMAGAITVGSPSDYLCTDATCTTAVTDLPLRHMLLKDSQVDADGSLRHDEDPDFCSGAPAGTPGGCDGQDLSADGGDNHTGGRWFFTVNGQANPTMTVASAGEIWRIVNTSASVTYDLNLWVPSENRSLPMKVLSIDGVAVETTATTGGQGKPCSRTGSVSGICADVLHVMPSSRVELWVGYRTVDGVATGPRTRTSAVLRTLGYTTGPAGDSWPAVQLASVQFPPGPVAPHDVVPRGSGSATTLMSRVGADLASANASLNTPAGCSALPAGHTRRIFFGVPAGNPDGFGLGYEEIDEHGNPVPGTFSDIKPFDPTTPTVCLPLAAGNTPAVEQWQLINLAGEDHNFHIHQVHFEVVGYDTMPEGTLPATIGGRPVTVDNVPVPSASNECSVAEWRQGLCTTHPVTVRIPFGLAGDFVYHCHILEHEDGGMMAVIRVRPASASAFASTLDRALAAIGLRPSRTTSPLDLPTAPICTARDEPQRSVLRSSAE
jgi:FtsP/CotA-like multicopper oxidase with cupredoxin domain